MLGKTLIKEITKKKKQRGEEKEKNNFGKFTKKHIKVREQNWPKIPRQKANVKR